MAISPYIRELRARVGHSLLVLPSVCVLPWRPDGALLMVENIETRLWQTIGGAVEPDEAPEDSAVREALEEAGVVVKIRHLRAVIGGPEFRLTYPNGDVVSYVTTVYDAEVISGQPQADGDETSAVAWWAPDDLPGLPTGPFTRALLRALTVVA
jgi:ADP-ribose pyrophosphatase YjhB (NUDIX family)